MDVVLIFNGLGNQMSQYAFFLAKKKRNKNCFAMYNTNSRNDHNGYELGRLFGIHCEKGIWHWFLQTIYRIHTSRRFVWLNKHIFSIIIHDVSEAKNYDYNSDSLEPSTSMGFNYYWGGWHSEKNFLDIKEEVKRQFKFPQVYDETCLSFIDKINNTENSVSLHIRRGDYLNIQADDYYQFGGVATLDYYWEAIKRLLNVYPDCVFFVFSNDPEWCKNQFRGVKMYVVDCNKGKDSWRDMYLMTLCKHHINANSSFSWWGSWLSEKEGLTICPKDFIKGVETKDFYPERWVKI